MNIRHTLLGGAASLTLTAPALADDAAILKRLDAMQHMMELHDRSGVLGSPVPLGGIRGGDQRIFTAALNWYPNGALKFSLQWQDDQVSRIGTIPAGFSQGALSNANVGQNFNAFAFRSQLAL